MKTRLLVHRIVGDVVEVSLPGVPGCKADAVFGLKIDRFEEEAVKWLREAQASGQRHWNEGEHRGRRFEFEPPLEFAIHVETVDLGCEWRLWTSEDFAKLNMTGKAMKAL